MPLALMGFSLRSVPPGRGAALSSSLAGQVKSDFCLHLQPPAVCRRIVKRYSSENKCGPTNTPYIWRSHYRVRSLPALVLPAAGGRCSRGIRDPPGDVTDCPCPKTILSCALGRACKQTAPGTSEYCETINQNLSRRRDPPLMGFLSFLFHTD